MKQVSRIDRSLRAISTTVVVSLLASWGSQEAHGQRSLSQKPSMGRSLGTAPKLGSSDHRALLTKLRTTRVQLDWQDIALNDALEELSARSGIAFLLSKDAKDLGDQTVRLKLNRARISSVLNILSDLHEIRFLNRHGVVYATTPEDVVKRTAVLRIHDARAVLHRPPNFKPPEIGLRGSNWVPPEREEKEVKEIDPDEIVDLLRRSTGEDQWEYDGVSIQMSRGRLIIRHTPTMQLKVARVLMALGAF